jgi:RNA polymerase sigma-70 factor (ECF subfamily)
LASELVASRSVNWAEAYRLYAPALVRYARRLVRDEELARDLVQDCFHHAMRAGTVPPWDELRPWLYRIATNAAVSAMRRQRLRQLLRLEPAAAQWDGIETAHLVRQSLASIPEDQAVALVLQLHEGFSRREIAEMLGRSEETIKSRLARGRLNFIAAYRRIERGGAR